MAKVKTNNIIVIIGIMITLILCSSNVFAYSRIYYDDEQNIDESKAKIKKEEAVKTAKEVLSKYFNCKVDDKFDERIQLREDIYPVKTSCWHISWSNNTVKKGTILELELMQKTEE
jgi:hypothetical protein